MCQFMVNGYKIFVRYVGAHFDSAGEIKAANRVFSHNYMPIKIKLIDAP